MNGLEKEEECVELKNIKYRTMLLNGNLTYKTRKENDLLNLEKFLQEDKINNENEPWSKLDKTIKTKKLILYAESYKTKMNLSMEEYDELVLFFKDCLDRKKLQRVKDVNYDKVLGEIKDIPALFYNKTNKHFTLKNMDNRISTFKSLPARKTSNKKKSEQIE
jgi:hypothetical protein